MRPVTERLGEPRLDVESCESTQLLVDTSLPEGAIVVADHQTAGRGRLGRSWEAPPGKALLFSILVYWIFCFAMSKYSQRLERDLARSHAR